MTSLLTKMFNTKSILAMLMLIGFGTVSVTMSKVLVTTKTMGFPPDERTPQYEAYLEKGPTKFSKSFSVTFIMFIGMSLSYPTWVVWMYFQAKRKGEEFKYPERKWYQFFYPAIPAITDCTATTLSMYALSYVSASTDSMLSGSQIIFTALLSFFFLKKKIWAYQILAIFCAILSLVLIGIAELGSGDSVSGTTAQRTIGIILIIVAFFVQSIQNVFLEKILDGLNPLEIVGLQGLWGIVIVLGICIPIAYVIPGSEYRKGIDSNGNALTSFESIVDTFHRLGESAKLSALYWSYLFILFFFNIGVITVINFTTALNFTIVSSVKSLLVWIIFLIVGAIVGEEGREGQYEYAEMWTKWSWSQLIGFMMNLVATTINNRFVELPCFSYPEIESEEKLDENQSSMNEEDEDEKAENEKVENEDEPQAIAA